MTRLKPITQNPTPLDAIGYDRLREAAAGNFDGDLAVALGVLPFVRNIRAVRQAAREELERRSRGDKLFGEQA